MNANERIQTAKRDWERWVLQMIRKNEVWEPMIGANRVAVYNAVDRLVARGKIRFDRRKHGYVLANPCRGCEFCREPANQPDDPNWHCPYCGTKNIRS